MLPHKMRYASFAFVFVGILAWQAASVGAQKAAAQSSPQLVEAVEVLGNRRLQDTEILALIKTRPGEPFSESRMERDLERLIESGNFDERQSRVIMDQGARGGVVVIFEVMELPLILDVTFAGLKSVGIEESEIVNALREHRINMAHGEVLEPEKLRAALQVIRDLLAARGREMVKVEVYRKIENFSGISIEFSFDYMKHY